MKNARPKNPAAVELGRLGGKAAAGKGIRKLNARRSPQERAEAARKAAQARWARKTPQQRREAAQRAANARWKKPRGEQRD